MIFFTSIFSCGDGIKQGVVHEQPLDTTRFVKVQLAGDLDEPMEIAITDEGNVIMIERKGVVKMYDADEGKTRQISKIDVYSGQEDGLLGIALDPNYSSNHFVYFFYSPAGNKPVQRVSRFLLVNDSLSLSSEKILLEIPTQREECCHSAGSLAFGPDGNLFIAVGDNTNPHNPGYYNSIDERQGREYWDAQRTAGNTNDLRGKILRIHPEPDGTYTIPDGNLFPVGTTDTKPEIYAMGCRNPYRIAVDQKKGWLYWGDVGQNTIDDPKRGPISYDEWHLAPSPGFFGWPYFAGPNAPYADFDFATNEIGAFFNPEKPINNSVNNTGKRELPPAKSALVWYSYDESKLFPHLGTGGKSPVAGPVFYTDLYKEKINDTTKHLHEYYNGKVFIAEWMRDWINVLTVTEEGKLDTIEPFLRGVTFHHPIELEMGADGMLYVLEYGTNWFAKNSDAGLFRVEYHRGEKMPVRSDVGKTVLLNQVPEIVVDVAGNKSFYWENQPISYIIDVKDKEDGSLQGGQIPAGEVKVSLSYTTMGTDLALVSQSHETITSREPDFPLIANSDCKACHAMTDKSVGPSYIDIAKRYKADNSTISKLAGKIIEGGSGAWGETHAMSAHPQISGEDAKAMVSYILSLKDEAARTRVVPAKGTITPEAVKGEEKNGSYILYASYKDKPQNGSGSNVAQQMLTFRRPEMNAATADEKSQATIIGKGVKLDSSGSWIMFRQIDLSGINNIRFRIKTVKAGGKLTLHLGVAAGADAGTISLDSVTPGNIDMELDSREGVHDLYFVYTGPGHVQIENLEFRK